MNLFISGADFTCVLILLTIFCAILTSKEKRKKKNRHLIFGIIALILVCAADGISFILDEYGILASVHFFTLLFSYLGADIIMVAFVYYITERIREKSVFSMLHARIVLAGAVLDALIIIFGAYSGSLFRIENGHAVYGALDGFSGIPQFIVIIYLLICIFVKRRQLEKKIFLSIGCYFLPQFIAVGIMFINSQLILSYVASTLSYLIIYLVLVQEDLQTSIIEKKAIHMASLTDSLTGLLNRKAYSEDTDKMNYPYQNDFVYMAFDLNELKQVNDNMGHAAGDELIVGASQCILESLGKYGKVYRIGGDEFVALLRVPVGKMRNVLDEFEKRIATWYGETVSSISLSYGYVLAGEMKNSSIEEVSKLADERMFVSKNKYYEQKKLP